VKSGSWAPRQLPLVTRPIPGELISSWLLRTAAKNAISLEELWAGLFLAYPEVHPKSTSLDDQLPDDVRAALARFCRQDPESILPLEIRQQFPAVPRDLFLAYRQDLKVAGRQIHLRARYEFCLECLREFSEAGQPACIPALWSLAPLTFCHQHGRPLLSSCPACSAQDPLLFPVLPRDALFRCRQCRADLTRLPIPWKHTPQMSAVIQLERAYLNACVGVPPDSLLAGSLTSTAFQKMIESFLCLFATYLPEKRQIVARYFLDAETVCQHFCRNQTAEAELKCFSWHWRYACLLSAATAIFGRKLHPGTSDEVEPDLYPFGHLLRLLPPELRITVVNASQTWSEPLQLRLWRAIRQIEGPLWKTPRSLRFQYR
jgi:TniQ